MKAQLTLESRQEFEDWLAETYSQENATTVALAEE
jgi:hypothetical protein